MIWHHDYGKERQQKEEKPHFLGSTVGLIIMYGLTILVSSMVMCWLAGVIGSFLAFLEDPTTKAGLFQIYNGNSQAPLGNEINWSFSNIGNFAIARQYPIIFWVLEIAFIAASSRLILKIHFRWAPRKANQYGNDRLTSDPEVLKQYPMIADRDFSFVGYGGVPVAHFTPYSAFLKYHPVMFFKDYLKPHFSHTTKYAEGFYAIDQGTVNTLGIGITRSGKDQTVITPLIDILSRATKKSSMVIFDPKTETLAQSYLPLLERGYDIEVLNLSDPNYSMSYNPLQVIIDYAKDGYYDEAQQAVNSLSTSIYNDPNAKDKFWQESSANLLNSLVLALIDHAQRNHDWSEITMDNIIHMMTDLGGKEVYLDQEGEIIAAKNVDDDQEKNRRPVAKANMLVIYFAKLRQLQANNFSRWRQMALDAFAQSKFSGDETTGNIYSSAIGPIKIYLQSNIARLTSMNTINFDKIGFPRMLSVKFPETYKFSTATIKITDASGKSVIESNNCDVDKLGRLRYAIRKTLPDKFKITIKFTFHRNQPAIQRDYLGLTGRKVYERNGLGIHDFKLDPYSHEPILKEIQVRVLKNQLSDSNVGIKISYSEKPVALFMVTPPNNPSYNQIAAFAVDQIFNTLWAIAEKNGRKLVTRLHFILNEFGNIPTINAMQTKISIGLGAGMLFDIFVQNLEQLEDRYTKAQAETIKANCANWLYILTNSMQTAQQISNMAGKKTVEVSTKNSRLGDARNSNVNSSYMTQNIFSPTELTNFMGGEMLTIRATHRQDRSNRSVVAYPIFAHDKTKMPFIYEFLGDEFNAQHSIADIGIQSPHRDLDLEDKRINFYDAYQQVLDMINNREFNNLNQALSNQIGSKVKEGQSRELSNVDTDDNELVDQTDDPEEEEVINEPSEPIFDESILDNHKFLADIDVLIYSFAQELQPDQMRSAFRQAMFDKTYDYWRDEKHNNWDFLKYQFAGNEDAFNEIYESINSRIEQLQN